MTTKILNGKTILLTWMSCHKASLLGLKFRPQVWLGWPTNLHHNINSAGRELLKQQNSWEIFKVL